VGYRIAAEIVMATHFLFVLYVAFGGLLIIRWRWTIWAHIPAVVWGAYIASSGSICPLTPLENWLRQRAGQAGYQGGFVERYIMPILYPGEITVSQQLIETVVVVFANAVIYLLVVRRFRSEKRTLEQAHNA
jgi:hypothetical protein